MPFVDVVSGTTLSPSVAIDFGLFEKKSAEFAFYFTDEASSPIEIGIPPETATFTGNVARCTSEPVPAVPDGLEHYLVVIKVLLPQRESQQMWPNIYRVWPATVDLELAPVDHNGNAEPARVVPFTVAYDSGTPTRRITAGDGTYPINVIRPQGRIDIAIPLPWRVQRWVTGDASAGRTRKAEVELFLAGFITPASGTKLEWAVNRKTTNSGADQRGNVVTVTVGKKGDAANGAPWQNTVVYIVATFSRTTARTDHAPSLDKVQSLVTTDGGKKQTANVTIGAGGTATFDVDLGFAGGETCKIEIGTEWDSGALVAVHDTLDFENWREFDYELLLPQVDGDERISDVTEFKSKTVAALPDDTVDALKRCLDPVKVRLKAGKALFCKKEHLDDDGRGCLFSDGAIFGKSGSRVLLLPTADAVSVMDRALSASSAEVLRIIVGDYIALSHDWTQLFDDIDREGERAVVGEVAGCVAIDRAIDAARSGFARGQYPISLMRWKVTQYRDASDWSNFPEPVEDGKPGWDYRDWQDFTAKEDIEKHIAFANDKIRFRFPTGKSTYPGQIFTVDGGQLTVTTDKKYELSISIELQGVCIDMPLGAAGKGNVAMSSCGNAYHPVGLARAIAHELGHCMGQAYGGKGLDKTRGRTNPMPGISFPAVVPDGDIYTEHGDRGIHCANGLTKKDESSFMYSGAETEAACTMFGHGLLTNTKEYPFCAGCRTHILAEKLDDIRKDWHA